MTVTLCDLPGDHRLRDFSFGNCEKGDIPNLSSQHHRLPCSPPGSLTKKATIGATEPGRTRIHPRRRATSMFSVRCGPTACSRQGILASVRQRIHVLAMQGISGLGVGANHTLERRHSAEKKTRALWRIFVISSFMFLRRRRRGDRI